MEIKLPVCMRFPGFFVGTNIAVYKLYFISVIMDYCVKLGVKNNGVQFFDTFDIGYLISDTFTLVSPRIL